MGFYECRSGGRIDIIIHAEPDGPYLEEYTTAKLQADGAQITLSLNDCLKNGNQRLARFTINVATLLSLIEKNGQKS